MKNYKGKKVYLKTIHRTFVTDKPNENKIQLYWDYEGYCDVDTDIPHGTGKEIEFKKNIETGEMFKNENPPIREGEFVDGDFYHGTYSMPPDRKNVGYFKTIPNSDSVLNGEGVEYYFDSIENFKKDKSIGHVKGFFKDGLFIKGEILNPSLIKYTEHDDIKKIIYHSESKCLKEHSGKHKYPINNLMRNGEIHYAGGGIYTDGDFYKGELFYDQPQGIGTMTYADGEIIKGVWDNGEYSGNDE